MGMGVCAGGVHVGGCACRCVCVGGGGEYRWRCASIVKYAIHRQYMNGTTTTTTVTHTTHTTHTPQHTHHNTYNPHHPQSTSYMSRGKWCGCIDHHSQHFYNLVKQWGTYTPLKAGSSSQQGTSVKAKQAVECTVHAVLCCVMKLGDG